MKNICTPRTLVFMGICALFMPGAPTVFAGSSTTGNEHDSAESLQIDLPATLRLAGARNLDIQIAREKLAEAEANRDIALWQFFPWITPGVTFRRHDNLTQAVQGDVIDADKESHAFGPTVIAQLDLGDAIYKNLAARQLAKAAHFSLEAQHQDSILLAAQGYFDLAKAQGTVGVAKEAVSISEDYSGQVKRAVDAGIAFKGDALRAEVQLDRNLLTLRQAQEQRRLAAARLVQVLHLHPQTDLLARDREVVPLEFISRGQMLEKLIAQAFANRPELKQSAAQLAAVRNAKSGAVYGPLFPSIVGQAFAGALGGGSFGGDFQTGESEDYQLTIGWRIGPGGLFDQGRIRAAGARVQIADLGAQKLADEIARQVTDAHTRILSLSDQLTINGRSVKAAEETLRLTRERKEFAVGGVLETIQAEQDLTRSRLDYVNAVAEYNKAQYSLERAIGKLPRMEPRRR